MLSQAYNYYYLRKIAISVPQFTELRPEQYNAEIHLGPPVHREKIPSFESGG